MLFFFLLWELFAVAYFPTVPLFLRRYTDLNWLMIPCTFAFPQNVSYWSQLCLLWSLDPLPLRVCPGRRLALAVDTMGLTRQHHGSVGVGVGVGSSYSCYVRGRSAIQFLVTNISHKLVCCFFSIRILQTANRLVSPLSLFLCLAGRNVLTLWMSSPSRMAWYVGR